jgi:hypothetical protein
MTLGTAAAAAAVAEFVVTHLVSETFSGLSQGSYLLSTNIYDGTSSTFLASVILSVFPTATQWVRRVEMSIYRKLET